ncbi:hypothetical protein ADS46_17555 [Halomonas sp. G11]|nr:hypothetical protein ADS46_17555 [Halomonas sp. G11]
MEGIFMEKVSIKQNHVAYYALVLQTKVVKPQGDTMPHHDHFPTIWDTPRKPRKAKAPSHAQAVTQATKPAKEAFLSIWDKPTRKSAV